MARPTIARPTASTANDSANATGISASDQPSSPRVTRRRLPNRATSAPAAAWLAMSPSMVKVRARPSTPVLISARSWIVGIRENTDANSAPLSAKIAVTAIRARTTWARGSCVSGCGA